MSRALTVLLGALGGLSLGFVASTLVKKIDSLMRPSMTGVLAISFIFGAVIAELIFSRFQELELRLGYLVLCSGLLVQSLIDLYTHRLVRQISHVLAVNGVLTLGFHSVVNSNYQFLVAACVCATLGVVVSFFSNRISRGSLGAGDVRLMAVLGWHLGFIGYSTATWALLLACVFASVFGVAMIVLKRWSWRQRIAFGPFLSLGSIVAIFSSEASAFHFMA